MGSRNGPASPAFLPMTTSTAKLVLVPTRSSSASPTAEAQVLAQLTTQHAQDLQVYAFRAGNQSLPEVAEPANVEDEVVEALSASEKEASPCPGIAVVISTSASQVC
jgi:hypothetical protein